MRRFKIRSHFLVALLACSSPAALLSGQQTSPAPGTTVTQEPMVAPTASKKELKAERKTQKHQEQAASENAKAQKDSAKALKHQDKATDAQQKVKTTAPTPQP